MNQTLLARIQARLDAMDDDSARPYLQAALAHACVIRPMFEACGEAPKNLVDRFHAVAFQAHIRTHDNPAARLTVNIINAYCFRRDALAKAYFTGEERRRQLAAQSTKGDLA